MLQRFSQKLFKGTAIQTLIEKDMLTGENLPEGYTDIKQLEQQLENIREPLRVIQKKINTLAQQADENKHAQKIYESLQRQLRKADEEFKKTSEQCEEKAQPIRAKLAELRSETEQNLIGNVTRTRYGTFKLNF